ncbi:hypothetical protein EVAR_14892_1 [Eumeta japonica]|uniref:Uncharacterized protein n=1 Tax=Eumeta variegata TaxID=151549 RepID=A0A4C1V351_EUMVA|nr:hypothetical protein EVAR_14892_1 [Eumeta japonica]
MRPDGLPAVGRTADASRPGALFAGFSRTRKSDCNGDPSRAAEALYRPDRVHSHRNKDIIIQIMRAGGRPCCIMNHDSPIPSAPAPAPPAPRPPDTSAADASTAPELGPRSANL